ncbi:MAG: tetratricopeptide repeat protein [Gemmatimonadales bacterium]
MITPDDLDPAAALRALLGRGRYQEVLDRHAQSEEASRDPAVALAVATAATRLGRYQDGQLLADRAHGAFRSRADDDGRLRALNLLGAIRYERGELAAAASHWTEALALARALADTTLVARTSNNLGITHYIAGRTEDARAAYQEALLAYQRLGDRRGLAETLHNLSIIARRDGALERAADLSIEAVRHAEAVDDPVLLSLVVIGRAKVHLDANDLEMTRVEAQRADALARAGGDELGEAEAAWVMAERSLKMGEAAAARDGALRAREIAERLESRLLQAESAELAGAALRRLGDATAADALLTEARALYQRLGAVPWLERIPEA